MTDEAAAAVANSFRFEAKKDGMRQAQDGQWTLTLKVLPDDMPYGLLTAAMGTRFVVAAVELSDDETAAEQPAEALETPTEQEVMGAKAQVGENGTAQLGEVDLELQESVPPASVATGRSHPTTEAASGQASDKTGEHRSLVIHGPRQSVEAWRLCRTGAFHSFLMAEYPDVMTAKHKPGCLYEDHCTAAVYHLCKTESRSDFDMHGEPRRLWVSLVRMYHHWRGIQGEDQADAQARLQEAGDA